MLRDHGVEELLQAGAHWPDQPLPAPLGTPDAGVHHQVDVAPLVLLLQVESLPRGNTERTARRPFIPRRTIGGFLALSCNRGDQCGILARIPTSEPQQGEIGRSFG
jgi:hypothetical protein